MGLGIIHRGLDLDGMEDLDGWDGEGMGLGIAIGDGRFFRF